MIDAIAKVVLSCFISQKQSSSILYLRCFTATTNNKGEVVDIFKVSACVVHFIQILYMVPQSYKGIADCVRK